MSTCLPWLLCYYREEIGRLQATRYLESTIQDKYTHFVLHTLVYVKIIYFQKQYVLLKNVNDIFLNALKAMWENEDSY